jgi:hypothetical protein
MEHVSVDASDQHTHIIAKISNMLAVLENLQENAILSRA